jgi:hypothetical protein
MKERGWGALSAKDWGKGILPGTVNKQAGRPERLWQERGCAPSNEERESLRVAEGGKLHRREEKTHFPRKL